MNNTVKIQIDLLQHSQFRELRDIFDPPNAMAALCTHYVLYQELASRAQSGEPIGRLRPKAVLSFIESLGLIRAITGDLTAPGRAEAFMAKLTTVTNYLVREGDDYVCPRFSQLNPEGDFRSKEARGGDVRTFNKRAARASQTATELSLLLPEEKFVDAAGRKLDRDVIKRLMMLIVNCDGALFLSERQPYAYTEALIQNAQLILAKFTDEQIDHTCRKVARNRFSTTRSLGANTDSLESFR